jgi:class 3 adenylate cyclase
MERYTLPELADRAGLTLEDVHQLIEAGVLEPTPDQTVPTTALNRVRLAHALTQDLPLADLARAIESGSLHFRFVDALFRNPVPLESQTYGEVVEGLGLSFDDLEQLFANWELPAPSPDQRLRRDDLQLLEALRLLSEQGVDVPSFLGRSRFLGENMRRLAESQVRSFGTEIVEPLLASGTPMLEVLEKIAPMSGAIQPAGEELVGWLHWRHFEGAVVHEAVQLLETLMEEAGFAPPRPAHPPAIAFLDVGGYTRLPEDVPDEESAEVAAGLTRIVWSASHSRGGRPVKFLGDGVMFHFEEPREAVVSALDILQQLEDASLPTARVGINAGPVVFRDGDYYGRTVNLASRIVDYARPREVLVSEEVVRGTPDGIEFESIGDIALKGILEPIPLYKAGRTHEQSLHS